ncbi:uncharacterized protein HMPREF1541_05797 [Cyphellophora europaea CBS 101466]|uniref:SEC7 domain-containing protein n=1 Tax=Cyphellophora europaea (strain CBS 101466) TaxID=1220924 RepID=W2RST0_CYPE1|nr:uncharacterized protein HMPREF1541_05797 [Cyphellophora europaea CBS 101466]ETN39571.1 hypothetical protein HMPREF1541_05797 [Cyphellophora europaea CBS 101466]
MPFPSLRSRPGTGESSKHHRHTIFEAHSPKKSEKDAAKDRMSVHIPKFGSGDFGPPLIQREEPTPSPRRSDEGSGQEDEDDVSKRVSSQEDHATADHLEPPTNSPAAIPESDETAPPRPQRFSLLRFKNASDPQLSFRFKKASTPPEEREPLPPAPAIITTSPTVNDATAEPSKKSAQKLFSGRSPSPFRRKGTVRHSNLGRSTTPDGHITVAASTPDLHNEKASKLEQMHSLDGVPGPPAYGDESSSQLAIPIERLSDSSRSDASSGEKVYARTTTTHVITSTTTFFKLGRRKKNKGPLFPLPEKLQPSTSERASFSTTGFEGGRRSMSPSRKSTSAVRFEPGTSGGDSGAASPTNSTVALTNAPFGSPGPSVLRKESTHSGQSTPPAAALIPPRLGARGRSSTMSSLGRSAERVGQDQPGSTRTSTSTTGRRSFGDLLSLPHRLRQNSVPPPRHGSSNSPGTPGSKSNSLQIPREEVPELVYPKRDESDTPASYLEKLEAAVQRGSMATILCKSADEFSRTCLRKYMRGFSYFGESIDMAIRKMLMEVELPKETQQIDRLLAGFADRYYECNPGIFSSTDETTFVAFSILLLHSDTHNKNNKRKMTKHDYFKNTQQGSVTVSSDILDCFYDNICYTPFIHFDDEVAINSHRLHAPRPKKSLIRVKSSEKLRGPVDPYLLILDNKLEVLRPSLKDVMDTEDTYRSTGTAASFDIFELHRAFLKSSVLQIVSARSRPDAFMSQATIFNPSEAQAGLVSIKVAKVGLLWRKSPKKKKTSSPWQEWGAILTDSKLYFFKDIGWVKKLISQHENHSKANTKSAPLIFKPALTEFQPDALISMDDAVALYDSNYKRHKNALVLLKHGNIEEVFLANSETDRNDFIQKINYAATFRSAGVRMRGPLGTTYEGRQLFRKDSEISTASADTAKHNGPLSPSMDPQAAWEIMFYRRQLISEKISDYDEKIAAVQKELETLLRNARGLSVCLPIQQKTRESLIMAAGRMSAKLKWTRVELWRNKTHRDVLALDLDQEAQADFPAPHGTPQKLTPVKSTAQSLARTDTETSKQTLSPTTSSKPGQSRRASQALLETGIDTVVENAPSVTSSPKTLQEPFAPTKRDSRPDMVQQSSTISQRLLHEHESAHIEAGEEQVLREAGLLGVDGNVTKEKRPDTSESERDRVGAISPSSDHFLRDRGSSVRRSLHRSLRDHHHVHASPSSSRHKKNRESGSSAVTEGDIKSTHSGESEELRRGTGSFILHGKKASVITMGEEWRNMSAEERMKMRQQNKKDDNDAVDDGTASIASRPSSRAESESVEANSVREVDPRKLSVITQDHEDFVDAKTSLEGSVSRASHVDRGSLFVDAKDFRSSMDSRSVQEESDEDESNSEDEDDTTSKGKAKAEDDTVRLTNSLGESSSAPGPAVTNGSS